MRKSKTGLNSGKRVVNIKKGKLKPITDKVVLPKDECILFLYQIYY